MHFSVGDSIAYFGKFVNRKKTHRRGGGWGELGLRFGDGAVGAVDGEVAGAIQPKVVFANSFPLSFGTVKVDSCKAITII